MISIEQFKNKKSVRYFQIFENDLGFSTGVPSLVSSTEPGSFYAEINYLNFYFKITNFVFRSCCNFEKLLISMSVAKGATFWYSMFEG